MLITQGFLHAGSQSHWLSRSGRYAVHPVEKEEQEYLPISTRRINNPSQKANQDYTMPFLIVLTKNLQ